MKCVSYLLAWITGIGGVFSCSVWFFQVWQSGSLCMSGLDFEKFDMDNILTVSVII